MELDRDALDRHITGGRYSKRPVTMKCSKCDEEWEDVMESEYGMGTLLVNEECPKCGASGEDLVEQ